EHDHHRDVQHGADHQRGDDAARQVALRILAFLGGGGDGVKADVGEENDRTAGEDSRPAVGSVGVPIGGVHESRGEADEYHNGHDLQEDHDVVGFRGFLDAAHQNDR